MKKIKTTPEISRRMSKLKSNRNKVEIKLAKALWHKGYRYRLNYKELPGSPDIALTKYSIAVFVDGEFWHGKDFDVEKHRIKTNKEFWINKIERNKERDVKNDKLLRAQGWLPVHIWSRDVEYDVDACVEMIENFVELQKGNM